MTNKLELEKLFSLPTRARLLLQGFTMSEGVPTIVLFRKPVTRSQARLRYEAWARLRDEETETGEHAYSLREIAGWFDVSHGHVVAGVDRARALRPPGDTHKPKRARQTSS